MLDYTYSEACNEKNYQCSRCKEWQLINVSSQTTYFNQVVCSHCRKSFTIKVEHRSTYRRKVCCPGQLSFPNGKKYAIIITNIGADSIGFTCSQKHPVEMAALKFCLPNKNQEIKVSVMVHNNNHLAAIFKIFDQNAIPTDIKTLRFWLREQPKVPA